MWEFDERRAESVHGFINRYEEKGVQENLASDLHDELRTGHVFVTRPKVVAFQQVQIYSFRKLTTWRSNCNSCIFACKIAKEGILFLNKPFVFSATMQLIFQITFRKLSDFRLYQKISSLKSMNFTEPTLFRLFCVTKISNCEQNNASQVWNYPMTLILWFFI